MRFISSNGGRSGYLSGKRAFMAINDQLFGIHGASLALRSQRLAMLASNIANAATPNYKARDIDFTKALALATQAGGDAAGAAQAAAA